MAYRIVYGENKVKIKLRSNKNNRTLRRWIVFGLVAVIVTLAMSIKSIRLYLLPGDPVVTDKALQCLVEDLRNGDKFSEAVTAFCEEILANA